MQPVIYSAANCASYFHHLSLLAVFYYLIKFKHGKRKGKLRTHNTPKLVRTDLFFYLTTTLENNFSLLLHALFVAKYILSLLSS